MTPLNSKQRYGLLAMMLGFVCHLVGAIFFPLWKVFWIGAWLFSAAGAMTYVIASVPGLLSWLREFIRRSEK
jgi:hypothetical protein